MNKASTLAMAAALAAGRAAGKAVRQPRGGQQPNARRTCRGADGTSHPCTRALSAPVIDSMGSPDFHVDSFLAGL
jgi:hypothetical protein